MTSLLIFFILYVFFLAALHLIRLAHSAVRAWLQGIKPRYKPFAKKSILLAFPFYFGLFLIIAAYINDTYFNDGEPVKEYYYVRNAGIMKPVIYLYPEKETDLTVTLGRPDLITCSYPLYTGGWEVTASPSGDLTYSGTGRKLYSLYYESDAAVEASVQEDGFVVKGEDSAAFLEEKLALLGLDYKESEEFIIYWLPKLESSPYNYIRFQTEEEIRANMPLDVSPAPDTVIRVMMSFRRLNAPIDVSEQQLTARERKGFTVVEWGGTEIEG